MIRSEMMRRMSAREFEEWLAFDRMDPCITTYREDLRAAIVAREASVDKYKNPPKVSDFIPKFQGSSKRDPQRTLLAMRGWIAAMSKV